MLIYGAGAAGRMLLREIQSNPSLGHVAVGFVDDNRRLHGSMVMNVPVIGDGRDIASIVDRYNVHSTVVEEVVVAMPSATARQTREAIANCRSAGVSCKTLPRFGELLTEKVLSSQIRDVNLVDLLGREPVRLEEDRIHDSIAGRCILITGAAGSIGSELCRRQHVFGRPGWYSSIRRRAHSTTSISS
jgi:FlaA1/EpsC-like NDP-sugar epimerase